MKKTLRSTALFTAFSTLCAWASAAILTVSVQDKDGNPVPDAVVLVLPANKGVLPKTPLPTYATIAQEKMQFIPAVTLLPLGARVQFVNNDSWDHHIRSSPVGTGQFNASNAGFEARLEGKSTGKPSKGIDITLDKAGVIGATLLGCYIHGSMRGYVYVSEFPWSMKTSAEGAAVFEGLPDGAAQIKVWQADQIVDVTPQQVTLGTTPSTAVVQLAVVPRRRKI